MRSSHSINEKIVSLFATTTQEGSSTDTMTPKKMNSKNNNNNNKKRKFKPSNKKKTNNNNIDDEAKSSSRTIQMKNKKKQQQNQQPKEQPSKSLRTKPNVNNKSLLPLTDLVLGSTINGHVAAFTSFGIFIKTNYDFKNRGSNGYALLHKSQIRDETVNEDDLKKLFRIGAQVKGLRVINVNYAKGEVGVSLRKQRAKRVDMNDIPIGVDIEGTVSKVVSYGAFVDVGSNVNALLHISRISQMKIKNIRQYVNEGDKVTIHIISKDETNKTMAASMLDKDADEYLERRSVQMEKMRESVDIDNLKSELEYFEDAVRELEEALGSWKRGGSNIHGG